MGQKFFDVTIICTTDDHQAEYWMDVLENGILSSPSSSHYKVLAVSEDWNNASGAGNGLGTLYAWQKACALARRKYANDFDLSTALSEGRVSAALYHTAGKGTRMAPLPASENNNKPGVVRACALYILYHIILYLMFQRNVFITTFFFPFSQQKLPFAVPTTDKDASDDTSATSCRQISVLEAVIRQTGIYARPGRLSVFWGDQIFLPTVEFHAVPSHHIDILCQFGETAPTAEQWHEQGLDKYGVIAVLDGNEAAQVEKVSYDTATQLLQSLGTIRQVGPSLGSFSVSSQFLETLCQEFATELAEKTGKLDTDPHFWMPLTLPIESYVTLMKQKGTEEKESRQHHARMVALKQSFLQANSTTNTNGLGLFGAVNVGKDACWWDYGQLKLYAQNCFLLLEQSEEAQWLRKFLGLDQFATRQIASQITTANTLVDETSYIFLSKILNGTIQNSILSNVAAASVEADHAIVVNCASSRSIRAGKGAIVYNVLDETGDGIVVEDGEIMVGVTNESGSTFLLKSRIDIDGGKVWKDVLPMNQYSFEQVNIQNKNANIGEIARKRQEKFQTIADGLK